VGCDDLLIGHESLPVGEHHEPAEQRGTLIRAIRCSWLAGRPPPPSVEGEARDVGEGVTGVDGEGVSTGRSAPEDLVQVRPVVLVQARPVAEADAVAVEVGHQPVEKARPWRAYSSTTLSRIARICACGPWGSEAALSSPAASCLRPPTRTWKNSSSARLAMARKRARSSSGRLRPRPGPAPRVEVEPGELAVDQDSVTSNGAREAWGRWGVGEPGAGRERERRAGKPGVAGVPSRTTTSKVGWSGSPHRHSPPRISWSPGCELSRVQLAPDQLCLTPVACAMKVHGTMRS